MWVQHNRAKPIWLDVKDKELLERIKAKGSFKWKGKDFIFCSSDTEFKQVVDIFYPDQSWEHYKKLKNNIKHFKQTGVWLND